MSKKTIKDKNNDRGKNISINLKKYILYINQKLVVRFQGSP